MGNACGAGSSGAVREQRATEYEFDEPAWKDISPSAKELISQLMTLDVEKRLTAEECFEDHEHRHDRSGAPEWLRDDTEAMDCPRFRGPISSLKS